MAEKLAFPGVRLQIARLLAEERMTLYEIARALGRTTGSLSGVVHRMTEEQWLGSDADPPVRGSHFWLRPEHLGRLEAELVDDQRPGALSTNQHVLIADASDRRAFYEVVARPAVAGSVAWVADFDGAGGRLVALREGGDDLDIDRLVLALQDAGIAVRTGRLGQPMEGEAVRRFAASTRSARTRAGGTR